MTTFIYMDVTTGTVRRTNVHAGVNFFGNTRRRSETWWVLRISKGEGSPWDPPWNVDIFMISRHFKGSIRPTLGFRTQSAARWWAYQLSQKLYDQDTEDAEPVIQDWLKGNDFVEAAPRMWTRE